MVCCQDRSHLHSQERRRYFGAIQEVCTQKANRNEEVEQEDEERGSDLSRLINPWEACCDRERHHTQCHPGPASHQKQATPVAINGEECHKTCQELPRQCATRQDPGCLTVKSKTILENDSAIH